jgi:hypothetical protein
MKATARRCSTYCKNITLANLGAVSAGLVIDDIKELRVANDYRSRMHIRSTDIYQACGSLSGSNQQKVVLSKWLFTDPEILILDEPTRGIDIGARYEIYCIIMSSPIPERRSLSSRRKCRNCSGSVTASASWTPASLSASSSGPRRPRKKSCAPSCVRANGWSIGTWERKLEQDLPGAAQP